MTRKNRKASDVPARVAEFGGWKIHGFDVVATNSIDLVEVRSFIVHPSGVKTTVSIVASFHTNDGDPLGNRLAREYADHLNRSYFPPKRKASGVKSHASQTLGSVTIPED